MIGHIDLVIAINECEKEIGKLNFTTRFGNYGEQVIEQLKKRLEYKKQELTILKQLERLYYEEL